MKLVTWCAMAVPNRQTVAPKNSGSGSSDVRERAMRLTAVSASGIDRVGRRTGS